MSVTNKTIRELETAAAEAVQAMNELTELLEGSGVAFLRGQRIANRLERLRIAAIELDRAETACSRERCLTMSEEEMREEFAALGLDWDETTERGHALLQRLLTEYDARREAETAKVAGKLAAGMGVGLEDAHDKIRAGASVDLSGGDERPRSGFKIPDAPAEPQPRGLKLTVLDVPPDTSEPTPIVRLDDNMITTLLADRIAEEFGLDRQSLDHITRKELLQLHAELEMGRRLQPDRDMAEVVALIRAKQAAVAEPQLLDLPLGHQPGGLGDGGKNEVEAWRESVRELTPSDAAGIERLRQITEARTLLKANGWEEDHPGEWSPAPALGWAIDINREECSPAILRALAILAEEAQS